MQYKLNLGFFGCAKNAKSYTCLYFALRFGV